MEEGGSYEPQLSSTSFERRAFFIPANTFSAVIGSPLIRTPIAPRHYFTSLVFGSHAGKKILRSLKKFLVFFSEL
jgi:hypothetical protein